MDSNSSPQDIKNMQRTNIVMMIFGILTSWIYYCLGMPPSCIIISLITLGTSSFFNAYSTPNFQADKFLVGLVSSFSPIWVFLIDPCAFAYTFMLTIVNTLKILIEYKNNIVRLSLTFIMAGSWIFVSFAEGTLISQCERTVAYNFKNDCIVIALILFLVIPGSIVQIDAIMLETKKALSQVRELNEKYAKLNNELKESLDDKDNFILLFSHETRNPLNILLGNLALLLDEADTPQIRSKLAKCKFCADLLLQHLNNILDTGKLANKGTLEVSPIPVKIYEYLQSITSFMDMLVKKKANLEPVLMIPERLPVNVKFDVQRVTQVLLNLLTNAVKFTDSGSISLVVRYLKVEELQEKDFYPSTTFGYELLNNIEDKQMTTFSEFEANPIGNEIQFKASFTRDILNVAEKQLLLSDSLATQQHKGYLKFEINDTGCGMKTEDLLKLFQKFSQTHSDGSQRQIGTGLGLWITKNLCELTNGNIKVFSRPKLGTCFVAIIKAESLPMTIPVPQKSMSFDMSRRNSSKKKTLSSQTQERRRILVVDDDPYNLEVHCQIVNDLGFNIIETATNGEKMTEKFKLKPEGYYELIITDINMPLINGIEAARLIREFEHSKGRKQKIKFGFITGHANQKDKLLCEAHPINALFYLSKPIKAEMLRGVLQSSSIPNNPDKLSQPPSSFFEKHSEIVSTKTLTKPLVLCVDDDLFNLECLSDMFQSLGAQTLNASSGEDGLSKLKSLISDKDSSNLKFILLDCRMPGMDGWTTCLKMKELLRKESKTDLPIIGLTGEDKDHNETSFRLSGMDDLIQKPISRGQLSRLLEFDGKFK